MVTNNSCGEPTASSGKVLQGQGIGVANNFTSCTYPSTASAGGILRSDGTNWVASTADYPSLAGTSGNFIKSNGSVWQSSAPVATVFFNGYLSTSTGDPLDATTYYMTPQLGFINSTTSNLESARFYFPQNTTINSVYGVVTVDGTLGSNENCTMFFRLNDTTNTNITTSLQLTGASNTFNATSLGLSITAGDYFTIGFTGPTWGTKPTTVGLAMGWSS